MFRYYLVLLFSIVGILFYSVIPVKSQGPVTIASVRSDNVQVRQNPIVAALTKIIGSLFVGAAASCLGGAIEKCKEFWKHPGEAIKCAKDFLKENKGKCAAGQ